MNNNRVSCLSEPSDNLPLVVSPRARGGAGAAGVPAQLIIHMLPLSAHCDLGWDGMGWDGQGTGEGVMG